MHPRRGITPRELNTKLDYDHGNLKESHRVPPRTKPTAEDITLALILMNNSNNSKSVELHDCSERPPGVQPSRRPDIERRKVSPKWRNDIIKVLHKENSQTKDGNYRGISLVAHTSEVILKIVPSRINDYCEANVF